ncbi:thiamine pyrophosphate-dependent enzyme [Rhodococcus sp. NPDC056743]|uniref:thiamine pyrophosphate-dependent enzyme n=1 Tax=Rhodococcus sp. NPDC056743 TaxID=3345934 RepID=UPI00366E1AFC
MNDRIDGGEAILAACRSIGIDIIFSSPGSEWAPMWEALAHQERDGVDGPRYIDLMHETLAVAMATGYGIVTRRPQMVLLHAVPGLLQGACGIHGALLAQVGMVVCSSESITYGETDVDPGQQWYRNLSIVGGPQNVAAPFTKWSTQVGSVETLYGSVVRAADIARRGPAGPVYLNVPVEVLLEPWDADRAAVRPAPAPGRRISLASEIDDAARRLLAAQRPVIITESAGRHPDGFDALLEFAELLSVPVIEPPAAVSTNFPRNHELHAGAAGSELIRDADLIILVCCRAPWYPPSDRPAAADVLVIDEVPHRQYIDYQILGADQYLEGEVGPTLRALSATVKSIGPDEWLVAQRRESRSAAARPAVASTPSTDTITAADLVDALREALDQEASVVDETITHSRVVADRLQADKPGRYQYVQGGLGQGIGVALGVKLAEPSREVALTIGDGSFLYNPIVQALAASKSLDLPILIVVINNHQYLSMKLNHLRFYPDGAAQTDQNFRGVNLHDQPSAASLVEPFGMLGLTVTRPDELGPALSRALASVRGGTTALVDVHVAR